MKNEFHDIGEKWLKENDPLYGDRKNNTYLTADMLDWTQRKEIPFSNLRDNESEILEHVGITINNNHY